MLYNIYIALVMLRAGASPSRIEVKELGLAMGRCSSLEFNIIDKYTSLLWMSFLIFIISVCFYWFATPSLYA